MYEAPKLVVFGQFRDLTQQVPGCQPPDDWSGKQLLGGDVYFPRSTQDHCIRS